MLAGSNAAERLETLNQKTYADQAKWFLNVFWDEMFENDADKREKIWQDAALITKLDVAKGKRGSRIPEIKAHIFLEKACEAVTWVDMRRTLKEMELSLKKKKMSLTEYLVFTHKLSWKSLANATASGGKAKAQMDAAQVKLEAAVSAQGKASSDAAAADDAANAAAEAQAAAEAAESAAKVAAAEAADLQAAAAKAHRQQQEAEADLKRVVKSIEDQQNKLARNIAKLKGIANSTTKGVVAKGKAFQEMKALEGQDPLPLRKAKLTQKALVKKQKKITKRSLRSALKAKAAAEAADAAALNATAAAQRAADNLEAAEAAAVEAQTSLEEAEKAVQEATDALEALKEAAAAESGAHGTFWWMERELEEAKKYMPKSKFRAMEKKMKKKKLALEKEK